MQFGGVRIMKPENNTYTVEDPNPDWKRLGEQWIDFAINKAKEHTQYKVAYIPSMCIRINYDNHEFYRAPQYKTLQVYSEDRNWIIRSVIKDGKAITMFRLYANSQNPSGYFSGTKANIDLNPNAYPQVILELFKIAERIYPIGTIDR